MTTKCYGLNSRRIGIIGAGISGLVCARKLTEEGHRVVVFEKSRSLSGRCASQKFGSHVVDKGVQYFTLKDEEVRKSVEQIAGMQLRKIVAPIFESDTGVVYRPGQERFYMIGGNNQLGKLLSEGIEVRHELEVQPLVPSGSKWQIGSEQFDVVISSAPWPQTAALIGCDPGEVIYEPNLTALLEYSSPWCGSSYAKIDLKGRDVLAWVACENAKEGRIQGDDRSVYIVQASSLYSRENFETDSAVWIQDLQRRVEKDWGLDPRMRGATFGHRWKYARRAEGPVNPLPIKSGIFYCGDSITESRVESVWKSGVQTAEKVLEALVRTNG